MKLKTLHTTQLGRNKETYTTASISLDTIGDKDEELIAVITNNFGEHIILTREQAENLYLWLDKQKDKLVLKYS